jgi:hypothetical protein
MSAITSTSSTLSSSISLRAIRISSPASKAFQFHYAKFNESRFKITQIKNERLIFPTMSSALLCFLIRPARSVLALSSTSNNSLWSVPRHLTRIRWVVVSEFFGCSSCNWNRFRHWNIHPPTIAYNTRVFLWWLQITGLHLYPHTVATLRLLLII